MKNKSKIEAKLEAFISKYYKNELLRGFLFFLAIGLSYFLIVLLVEYFLWLRPAARTFLFWSFVGVELLLLYRFILVPLARLFKLAKGIDFNQASVIIGKHFPEVSDKLVNTLQLKSGGQDSDLVLASIAQKEKQLEPVPFSLAIDYRKNLKYLKYTVIPFIIFIIINFAGGKSIFDSSYERMVNYDQAYEPPAPFSFVLLKENSLETVQHKNYSLQVKTTGEQIPENAQIVMNGNAFYMNNGGGGNFSYIIEQPDEDVVFHLNANGIRSRDYKLKVIKAPLIEDFNMHLDYPDHTQKKDEIIQNTGSYTVPEGTQINWELQAANTSKVVYKTGDSIFNFTKAEASFSFSSIFKNTTTYHIATSNEHLDNYEDLQYKINVIKDAFPAIEVSTKKDTLSGEQQYHQGTVSDDYGLTSLYLIYYKNEDKSAKKRVKLPVKRSNVDQFLAAFPDTLSLEAGTHYSYYFQVADNDVVNHFKTSRSETFSFKKLSEAEQKDERLQQQQETIENLDKSLIKAKESEQELQKLSKMQKEGASLNYNQQQQLKNYLQRQQQQKQMMQNYSERLKKNLERFQQDKEDKEAAQLQKRLEANEKQLEEQEKLLDELEKLREKLNKEQLNEKLEQLGKQNKNSEKSLKQLVELTKRYYVEQKMERIAEEVKELSRNQEELSENQSNNLEKQKKLSEKFKEIEESLEKVGKENEKLEKPMDLPQEKALQQEIEKEQQEAEKALEESAKPEEDSSEEKQQKQKQKAGQKQQKAAEKMKELAQKMQAQMTQSGSQTLEEDTEMLRQILDNLVLFSFNQEDLMADFRDIDNDNPIYARKLVQQNVLKENFEHIDDSLFALSLRVPQLEEHISEELTNVDYSLNQSLERFAENHIPQGIASQQYVITGANSLADMLSSILNNMQDQLSGSGSGKGGKPKPGAGNAGEQLSDIIMSQEQLSKKMGEGKKPGGKKEGKSGEGEKGENGKKPGGKQGKSGSGEENQEGSSGQGMSEEQRAEQYEIFKQQQQLRNQLEDLLQQEGLGAGKADLLKQMEDLEDQLLDSGLNENSRRQMNEIKHELMKLENAVREQGEQEARESQTNRKEFIKQSKNIEQEARKYFDVKELLNRNPLPLNSDYKIKVQNYFNSTQ